MVLLPFCEQQLYHLKQQIKRYCAIGLWFREFFVQRVWFHFVHRSTKIIWLDNPREVRLPLWQFWRGGVFPKYVWDTPGCHLRQVRQPPPPFVPSQLQMRDPGMSLEGMLCENATVEQCLMKTRWLGGAGQQTKILGFTKDIHLATCHIVSVDLFSCTFCCTEDESQCQCLQLIVHEKIIQSFCVFCASFQLSSKSLHGIGVISYAIKHRKILPKETLVFLYSRKQKYFLNKKFINKFSGHRCFLFDRSDGE